MAMQGNQRQATGTSRNQPRAGENAFRESDIAFGGISRERGQESLFHRSEERQESGSVYNNGQGQGTQNREVGNEHDQRLYESLQRHLELVREAVERAKRNQSKTDRADRNIEQSESRIEESERAIDQSQQCYNHSKRGIEKSQQRIDEKVRQEQVEKRANIDFYR
jgi:hypothetical protein